MMAGLYQFWKQLVHNGTTNLSYNDWKYAYMNRLKRKEQEYKNKKPRRRGLEKWMKKK